MRAAHPEQSAACCARRAAAPQSYIYDVSAACLAQAVHNRKPEAVRTCSLGKQRGNVYIVKAAERIVEAGGKGAMIAARSAVMAPCKAA